MAGRRTTSTGISENPGHSIPVRPVGLPEDSPPKLLMPSARPLLFMAAKNMTQGTFGRFQECVSSLFTEMDISRLDPTLRNIIVDQAFNAFAWLNLEDATLPPEKAEQYTRTVLSRLVQRKPENFFTTGVNVDGRTAICITGAIQFSRIFAGIRKFQRPDENFNLLCGKVVLDDFLPVFYRDSILAPALNFFKSYIEPANEVSLKNFLVPWLRAQAALVKKVGNDIWTANLSPKTTSSTVASRYLQRLREISDPASTPFMQTLAYENEIMMAEVERIMASLKQYQETCLSTFNAPKILDPITREDYVSYTFRFRSDLTFSTKLRRIIHQYGKENVMGTLMELGNEIGRILREEKGPKLLQSQTAIRNIVSWCLDCVQNKQSFIQKFLDPDDRPLMTGDIRGLLSNVDFAAKLPFEVEEFGAGPRRQMFDLAMWLHAHVENPDELMAQAAKTTETVIRGSEELAAARSLYTKKEPGDGIAAEIWQAIFGKTLKACGSLEIAHDEMIEMLSAQGRAETWNTIRKPLEDTICKGWPLGAGFLAPKA